MYLTVVPLRFNVPTGGTAARYGHSGGAVVRYMYLTAAFFQLYRAISLDRGFKSKNAISKRCFPKLDLPDSEKKIMWTGPLMFSRC